MARPENDKALKGGDEMQPYLAWLSKMFFFAGALMGIEMTIISLTRLNKTKNKKDALMDDLALLAIAITWMLIGIGMKQGLLPL